MLSCFDVANYFLTKVNEEDDEVITHLKLQKLAYYAQSASLAFYDSALFSESLKAWKHGPVVPELYQVYKKCGNRSLPKTVSISDDVYSAVERKLMDGVYAFFGQYAAWKLRDMTHEETPWLEAFPTEGTISTDSMRKYFRAHWADEMCAFVGDPDDLVQQLLGKRWEPTAGALEAALRYKQGRVDGDKYVSGAV